MTVALEPNIEAIKCECDKENSSLIDKYECMDCNESVEYGCLCFLEDETLTIYCHGCETVVLMESVDLVQSDDFVSQLEKESHSQDVGEWKVWKQCRHYNFPVELKNGVTIYASSNWDREIDDEAPDFGLYLDTIWRPSSLAYFVDWGDYGLPERWAVAAYAIIDTYNKAAKFGLWVEVGCIGGHGRTGTVLACMAVLSGMHHDEAIEHIRKAYCKDAIETKEQQWFVEWFDVFVNGGKTSRKPGFSDDPDSGKTFKFDGNFGWEEYSPNDFPQSKPKTEPETVVTNYKHLVKPLEGEEIVGTELEPF